MNNDKIYISSFPIHNLNLEKRNNLWILRKILAARCLHKNFEYEKNWETFIKDSK